MPLYRFRSLGGIELLRDDGSVVPEVTRRPKGVALLNYLGLARPRGVQRRDTLLAVFWPEARESNARNALSQSLHVLRKALGDEVFTGSGTQEIGVAPGVIAWDVITFEDELGEGRPGGAFDLYRGAFLPGLHVSGSLPFEHWLDLERGRLRRMAREAARGAASDALAHGEPDRAGTILHRAVELFPEDEGLFLSLVDLLEARGGRDRIASVWEAFRTRREQTVGLEPSDEVRRRVETILRRDRSPGATAEPRPPGTAIRSVAVLPLKGRTRGDTTYGVDGMTEALVAALGQVRSLRVISHQSVLRFKDSTLPLPEIARMLAVDALVEGSVLESGGRVRVTAQLVRAEPEEHLWADAFEGDARDVIGIHREVARSVADAVSAMLSEPERRELSRFPQVQPEAYDAFLRGWQKHATVLPMEVAKALDLYGRSIRIDPTFAPPRANLVDIHFLLMSMGEEPLEAGLETVVESAELAVALAPDSALTHTARGLARMLLHDWAGAEESLTRATAMNPNLALAHGHLCAFWVAMGRFDDAVASAERTRRLDPLAPYAHWMGGWTLHYARRSEASVDRFRAALGLFPDHPPAWIFLAKSLFQTGDLEATVQACDRTLTLVPESSMGLAYMTSILARSGEPGRAEEVYARFLSVGEAKGYVDPYYHAVALGGLGRRNDAMDLLDGIHADASPWGWLLPVDPALDPLREDPRFSDLLTRVGLPVDD